MADVFISYAQNFEDVILYRALKEVEQGFYIDVGAWDPVIESVTKAFYDRGWSGINIEPSRTYFEKLAAERPRDINLMVAAGNKVGLIDFYEILETGLSTANKEFAAHFARTGYQVQEYQVPCLPLATICEANGVQEIHFLKIDVEGMEAEVVEGCNFARFRPWIIVIEAIDPVHQKPVEPMWEGILFEHGYELVYYDGLNRFYLARERAELKKAFTAPPGIFDGFVRYSEWELRKENEHLQERVSTVEDEKRALGEQVEALQDQLLEREQMIGDLRAQLAEVRAQASTDRESLQSALAEANRRQEAFLQQIATLQAERDALRRRVEELRAEQEARLAEISKVLSGVQAEKEELRAALTASTSQQEELRRQIAALQAERDALRQQVEELHRWLQAVYATISWRITALLRMAKRAVVRAAKGVQGALVKTRHWVPSVMLRLVRKMACWAARDPRLRSLGKKLLSKNPHLRARVRRLIAQETLTGLGPAMESQSLPKAEQTELPESARAVLDELKAAIAQVASEEAP